MAELDFTNKTEDEINDIVNKCNGLKINESFSIPEGTIRCSELENVSSEEDCIFSGDNCYYCSEIKCCPQEREDKLEVEFVFTHKRKNSKNK